MRFVLEESSWRWDGSDREGYIERIEQLLDRLDVAQGRDEPFAASSELQHQQVYGEWTLVDLLWQTDSPLALPWEVRERLATRLGAMRWWDEGDEYPAVFEVEIGEQRRLSPGAALCCERVHAGRATACLPLAGHLSGPCLVRAGAVTAPVHFVTNEKTRLLGELPGSAKEAMALYNAGLAHKGRKDYEQAAARFARLAQEHPGSKDVPDALFHLGACQAELARWQESLATFDRLLLRQDLDLSDRVEAMSRRGVALLELGRLEEAERAFRQTMAFFRENEATERLDSDYYLALSQFQLGEIARRYFQALPLRLPQLEQDIEAKARMFLTAQARYLDTVRLKNPTWATAAGYQIGALYRELYEMLVSAPLPKEVDTDEAREVYLDLTRRRLRVLLSRARHIHEKNLEMAGRVGVDNGWVERSSAQLRELSDLLASLPQAE